MTDDRMLINALDYVEHRAWPVIPLQPPIEGDRDSGKRPIVANYQQRQTTSTAEVEAWLTETPQANLGLPVGPQVGLFVLDVDLDKGGEETLAKLECEHGDLPATPKVITGSGGWHLYFRYPDNEAVGNRTNFLPGLDIRGKGGQVVLPPSVHFSGGVYTWALSFEDTPAADAPAWLLDLIRPEAPTDKPPAPATSRSGNGVSDPAAYARSALDRAVRDVENAPEGQRNHTLNAAAYGVRDIIESGYIARSEVFDALTQAGARAGLKPQEIQKTLSSGLGDAQGVPMTASALEAHKQKNRGFDPSSVRQPGAYARAALRAACDEVATLADLEATAQRLAEQFLSRGWLTLEATEVALQQAGERTGAPAADVREAILRGFGDIAPPAWTGATTRAPPETPTERAHDEPDCGNLVPNNPLDWADAVLRLLFTDYQGRRTLVRYRADWWVFSDNLGAYDIQNQESMLADVWGALGRLSLPGKDGPVPMAPTSGKVHNTMQALLNRLKESGRLLPDDAMAPVRLDGRPPLDPMRTVATRSGLFDLVTGDLEVITPDTFVTQPLDVAPDAQHEPQRWLGFLRQLWPEDLDAVDLLQQWFGYCLVPDVRQQKILLLQGPTRSGKGVIIQTMYDLLDGNFAGLSSKSLTGSFAMAQLLGKLVAANGDVRFPRNPDAQRELVDTYLSLSGGDPVEINRKFKAPVTTRLPIRLMLASNELPAIFEESDAFAKRFLVLRTTESYLGREDRSLQAQFRAEMPGIFQWAVQGWRDLQASGRLPEPAMSRDATDAMAEYNSGIREFVEDCCEVIGPDEWHDSSDRFQRAYENWAQARNDRPMNWRNLMMAIRSVVPCVKSKQHRVDGRPKTRWMHGIKLREGIFANQQTEWN